MGKLVAIIENDQDISRSLMKLVLSEGWSPIAAGDGQQGLTIIQKFRPDLIILDADLPTLNGSQVLRGLEADSATRHLPVLMLAEKPELVQEGPQVWGVLARPPDAAELLALARPILA